MTKAGPGTDLTHAGVDYRLVMQRVSPTHAVQKWVLRKQFIAIVSKEAEMR